MHPPGFAEHQVLDKGRGAGQNLSRIALSNAAVAFNALAKNPDERYRAARALYQELVHLEPEH
jgi:hypothetical protein